MKLRSKQEINIAKSTERKLEIDQGVALAKKVDTLRELTVKEQANLQKFRDESLAQVKKEISLLLEDKTKIQAEIVSLREEKIRLEAPIDLKREWAKVKQDAVEVEAKRQENNNRDIYLLAREVENATSRQEFEKREFDLTEKEVLTLKYLQGAEQNLESAKLTREKTEEMKEEARVELEKEFDSLKVRLNKIRIKEHELKLREEQVQREQQELNVLQIQLKDQRETLERAFNRLKK